MRNHSIIAVLLLVILLAGCNLPSIKAEPTTTPTAPPTLEFVEPSPIEPVITTPPTAISTVTPALPRSTSQAVLGRAAEVVNALKDKNMNALSAYIDPQLGLRFSPYAAAKVTDLVFTAGKVASLLSDPTIYTWGAYDGTGEPIQLSFAEYFSQFIYDVDFANAPQVALNQRLGKSTTLDNSQEFYPNAMIVEYYFPGFDPQYDGMDWRSLRLVFHQDNATWYLIGILHDQWTT